MQMTQLDMLTGQTNDPMIGNFEARGKEVVNRLYKERIKSERATKAANDSSASKDIASALAKQTDVLAAALRRRGGTTQVDEAFALGEPGGLRGGQRRGGGDGRGWAKGRKGPPGQAHYKGCFVCGSSEHRAAECTNQ